MEKEQVLQLLALLAELVEKDQIRAREIRNLSFEDVLNLAEAEARKNIEKAGRLKSFTGDEPH